MSVHSTIEVARQIGVGKSTLLSWLYQGKVPEPKRATMGGMEVRLWNDRDLERVRKYKAENFRKGRGRKAKRK